MKYEYLKAKKESILSKIQPICEAFGLTEYDYQVDVENGAEWLILDGQRISCVGNSEEAVIDEIIGYLFVKRYCRHRPGIIPISSISVVKRYWY